MDAASQLFVREGFENVSMRRIAERIQYSPAAIYRYFKNKREILSVLRSEAFARFNSFQEQAEREMDSREADPVERLRAGGRSYVRFAMEHTEDYRIMFDLGPGDVDLEGPWAEEPIKAFGRLEDAVSRCMELGWWPGREVREVSVVLWSATHGLVSLVLSGRLLNFVEQDELTRLHEVMGQMLLPEFGQEVRKG